MGRPFGQHHIGAFGALKTGGSKWEPCQLYAAAGKSAWHIWPLPILCSACHILHTPSSNSYPPAPVPDMYATPKAGVVSCTNKVLRRGRFGLLAPTPCRACRRARRGTVEQHNDRHNARAARRPHSTFAPPAPTASRVAIQPFGIPTPLLSLSRGASTDAPPLIARPHTCPAAPRCRRSTALFSGYDTSV